MLYSNASMCRASHRGVMRYLDSFASFYCIGDMPSPERATSVYGARDLHREDLGKHITTRLGKACRRENPRRRSSNRPRISEPGRPNKAHIVRESLYTIISRVKKSTGARGFQSSAHNAVRNTGSQRTSLASQKNNHNSYLLYNSYLSMRLAAALRSERSVKGHS